MPRHHATDAQVASALHEVEAGTPIVDVARRLGVHVNTMLRWRKKYGSLGKRELVGSIEAHYTISRRRACLLMGAISPWSTTGPNAMRRTRR